MITIGQIIDDLTASVLHDSKVDKLIYGERDTEVTGIVTAFTASQFVVDQAIALGANLIITHEGVFYSHHEVPETLYADPVFLKKHERIQESELAIFRLHDCIHRYVPDGITAGLIRALDWETYVKAHQQSASFLMIPEMQLRELAEYLKRQLHIDYLRVAGNPAMSCSRVGILVGYRGSASLCIPLYQQDDVDVIIAGEGPEWETPEYVKDAVAQGNHKALIFLGHQESEAPGMKLLADKLAQQYAELSAVFVPEQSVFHVV